MNRNKGCKLIFEQGCPVKVEGVTDTSSKTVYSDGPYFCGATQDYHAELAKIFQSTGVLSMFCSGKPFF